MSTPDPKIDRTAATLGLVLVWLANARYLAGFGMVFDPPMSMEPYYIELAEHPATWIMKQNPAWGPLYALWLKPLRSVFDDPLVIIATNVKILSFIVSSSVYLCTLVLTRRTGLAVATALFFIASNLNVPLESKICSFALGLVLLGITLSELTESRTARIAVAALGVLIASYARPELFPAASVLWIAASIYGWRDRQWSVVRWLVPASVVIAAVAVGGGTPIWTPGYESNRLFDALREHFAQNWARWSGEWRPYSLVWHREFGDAGSVSQAVLANPTAIARHLLDNLRGVAGFLAFGTFKHSPLVVPQAWASAAAAEAYLFSASFVALGVAVLASPSRRRATVDRFGHLALPLGTVAVFSLGAATFIFPKPHYLAVPAAFLLIVAALLASVILPRSKPLPLWVKLTAAVLCLAAVPTPYVIPEICKRQTAAGSGSCSIRPVTDTVHQIRALGLTPPVHVLTFTDGFGELLGTGFEEIKVWQKGDRSSLATYIRDNHVDIVVTMEGGRDSFLTDDPLWTLIETQPEKAGFTRLSTVDPSSVRVYLRDRTERVRSDKPERTAPGDSLRIGK